MATNLSTSALWRASVAACLLLLGSGVATAQSSITLTAGPTSVTMPDGQVVPMWGYACGASSDGNHTPSRVSCTAANGAPQTASGWQPPLIRVPSGQPLKINLINKLYDKVPTSLVIVGQLGGGLGDVTQRATMPSPTHGPQGTTWPGTAGGIDPATAAIAVNVGGKGYVLPPMVAISGGGGSGAAAVATIAGGVVTAINVTSVGSGYIVAPTVTVAPPPCAVNGTTCIAATATMSVDVLQSSDGSATFVPPPQADRVRSFGTEVTVADGPAGKTLTWNNLRPGTYLIESGTQPSIQAPMGLYGVLVVTEDDVSSVHQAYGTKFDSDVALLLSEIDPVQNAEVDQVVRNPDFSDTKVWSGRPDQCGDLAKPASAHTCYPPAVNYTPQYYLVNGLSFDRTSPLDSTLPLPVAAGQGNVLLRFVNAGLRMHVPSVVGSKMTLIAEDGNRLPGTARVQTQVLLTAGKTYDVAIQPAQVVPATSPPTYADATYPVFDRALSLSTANQRDGGMQAYVNVGKGGAQSAAFGSAGSAATKLDGAGDRTFYCVAGTPLTVADPGTGLLAGVSGANGVILGTTFTAPVSASNVVVQSNGTFTYTPPTSGPCAGSFSFFVNKTGPFKATIADCASNSACAGMAPTAGNGSYTSNIAARLQVAPPGVLALVTDNPSGYALTALSGAAATTCAKVTLNPDGSFVAMPSTSNPSSCTFTYKAATATQVTSTEGTVTVNFQAGSGLVVSVYDAPSTKPGQVKKAITDYRWIIEEDRTFWVDPKCQVNTTGTRIDSQGKACPPLPVESLGYNFHTANMPVVAQGCWGTDPSKPLVSCEQGQTLGGVPAVCDGGNGVCRVADDANSATKKPLDPGSVHLDPNKRYFISVLPGDGVNPTIGGAGGANNDGTPFSIAKNCKSFDPVNNPAWVPGASTALCGHGMGGAQIAPGQTAVTIALQQTPLPTAKIAVFVYQDDNPLNGENDAGGGVDVIAPNEAGLGGFEIKLFDQAGGLGDNTGQPTYDEFNQPLTNALAGKIDPITGLDSCPITNRKDGPNGNFVGMIPTCPKYESDGKTLSPLAGQAIIANLYPGLYEIQAYPAADRIARGEEWLQTNTLDGGKPHEAFIKPNEPGYFQEFGPGGFHVSIGFANPKIINARKPGVCSGQTCTSTLTVNVSNNHMSRTPDQRTYSSGSYDHYAFTQCYVSVGLPDGIDFAFEKCSPDGVATFTGMPAGTYKISVFDQWNDIMLDGLVSSVTIAGNTVKDLPVTQWRTNLSTRTYIDGNGNGIPDRSGATDLEAGLSLVNTNIRYRDGSFGFFNNTDLNGYAGFNEVFPFMNWLVVETSSTRFKPTGVHTVYDAGGPPDGTGVPGAGSSLIGANLANTVEKAPLPAAQRVPGAVYCADADCIGNNLKTGNANGGPGGTSGAVMPPQAWGNSQGWQGLLGQDNFIEFGMKPFAENENGGINGHVIYASTRPFDDPSLSLQLSWEPGVPRVRINLYSKSVDEFGHDKLTLVDHTTTTSWDDWAQGFRRDAAGNLVKDGAGNYVPNMNCPGQDSSSPFFATLAKSSQWLDPGDLDPAHPGKLPLAMNSQFKCYDGWSQLNQIQPAPYDGMYSFPSVVTTYHQDTVVNGATRKAGQPATTNCTVCIPNPDSSDPFRAGLPMLPPGKYVVEVIVPQGYELVKEEDKNILLGDVYIAPVTQQFAGFGNIFIMPDQASVNAHYNGNNPGPLNTTNNLGSVTFPRHEGDTGSIETYWPCVGAKRIVPDLNSLFPGAGQAAPFAGALRNLCDRKEVTLQDQASALAKFYVFSSTHIAGHFAGTITNDFASEFDPFSPQFGEKFGPPNLPVGMRDFNGNEVARVYSDQWGIYNGLFFSSWSVNPPNPTGYAPQMSIACMNDPGPIPDPSGAKNPDGSPLMITDPAYNPAYSNFCYETPFMPGFTAYMDTPVIPTQAFADGYNLPDSEYPNGTPAIKAVVNSDASAPQGPWVTSGAGQPATVQFTISDVTAGNIFGTTGGDTITSIVVGGTTVTGGTITCNLTILCVGTNAPGQPLRNSVMAGAVAASINARTAITHYSATVNLATATVTVTAPSGTLNGTTVTINRTGVTITPTALALGGASGTPPSLGITITALGDKVVQNPNFSGPNSTTAPFNQKTITRHYGFGSAPSTCPATGDCPNVTIGGVPMTGVTWTDTSITGTVNPNGVPACSIQQRGQPSAQCGELVITAANGKQSIDAVTVTIGGSAPWYVTEAGVTAPAGKSAKDYTANFGRMDASPLQAAIDSASPGDLILVAPGTYRENLLMWKPVRLQGVGAASVTINADAHPAGKMDQWRRQVNCVFGLSLDGTTNLNNAKYSGTDPNNNGYSCPNDMHQRVDRIPFEAIVGWDASGNGNLAQVLQEPTLMGAYEGAGITVLGRGMRAPACNDPTFGANCQDFWGVNATGGAGAFTDGSTYLSNNNADCATGVAPDGRDYGTSNFQCNPSRIDGMSILNSSQGGGALFIHGWSHNLEVGNTRISGNHGTLAGGINLGNGETPDAFVNDGVECGAGLAGAAAATPCPPIPNGTATNAAIPFAFNKKVRIHHNMIYNNASIGDALFSGTPAGAGAITVSAGADDYQIDHNWIAGNLSTGDGGGVQHLGLSFRGRINNNYILFNQTTNPTLPTNGGGLVIEGANLDRQLNGTECGSTNDQDCPPGLGEGTGPGLVIDANLILGNSAESGSGGGLRIQQVNGSEVVAFPRNSAQWYDVTVTNNIIANNVAGWDGGGVSMQDALLVSFINNTVASNDTTASAGSLFKTLGAIDAASPPPGCTPQTDPNLPQDPSCTGATAPHGPQPAGLVTMLHTPNLLAALPTNGNGALTCPSGFGYGTSGVSNNDCRKLSKPKLLNNLFWQNRAFSVNIVGSGSNNQSQQQLIALTPVLSQAATGACASGADFRDIGLRTDDIASGLLSAANNKLTVSNSVYTTDFQGVITGNNNTVLGANAASPVVAQYCNGARVPPENCAAQSGQVTQASCKGYNAPVGASETTSTSQLFAFNGIQPTATVDEGHNWLNLVYGPLTLSRPNASTATNAEMMVASRAYGTVEGAYSIPSASPAVTRGTTAGVPATVGTDFFGNARSGHNDAGAVQFTSGSIATVNPTVLGFGDVGVGATSAPQTLTLSAGIGGLTGVTIAVSAPFARPSGAAGGTCLTATLGAGVSCTVVVTFKPTTTGSATGTMTVTASNGTVAGSPVVLGGNGIKRDLTVTASSTMLQFGDAFVGTTTPTQAVTLTNTSTSPITGIAIGGLSASGPFARATGGAGDCATTLAVGANCTVTVAFKPTELNPVLGGVTVSASTPSGAATVEGSPLQLTGNGVLPGVSPASVDFGTLMAGTSAQQTLTLSNATNVNSNTIALSNLQINVATVTGSGFSRPGGAQAGTCGASLPAGATCTITVRFQPAGAGVATGTVTITGTNDLGAAVAPIVVSLTGAGSGPTHTGTVAPGSLTFPSQVAGTTSPAQALTLTNTGNSGLGGLSYAFGGNFARPSGAAGGNCGNTLAVGASCTVNVQFVPATQASYPAPLIGTLTINGNNGAVITGSPVSLSGTALAPPTVKFTGESGTGTLNVATQTLDFGNNGGGTTPSNTLTLTVTGASVTFGSPVVTNSSGGNNANPTPYTLGANTCTGTKNTGSTCTIAINFNRANNNTKTGSLSVPYSGGSGSPAVLNLTGN